MNRLPSLLLLLLLPSCATVMKGSTQTVAFDSSPHGASCTVDRTGARLAAIPSTPGSVLLHRDSSELVVTCSKDGFMTSKATVASKFNGATLGNILVGGIIGAAVDMSTGANFSYPDAVQVELGAAAAPALPPVAAAPLASGPGVLQVRPVSVTVPMSPSTGPLAAPRS